ncbi:hypothetical protein D3C83_50360 [compost metagenome]
MIDDFAREVGATTITLVLAIVCVIILKSPRGSKGMFLMSAGLEPKLLIAVTMSV